MRQGVALIRGDEHGDVAGARAVARPGAGGEREEVDLEDPQGPVAAAVFVVGEDKGEATVGVRHHRAGGGAVAEGWRRTIAPEGSM